MLKQLLGGHVDEREEKYGLNWHGKRLARQLALTPSSGTLRPCPGDGVDEATTQNIMIEGDNLEVLKLLQKSYSGKVKLIYIDPPYNTGKDFVYPDNFRDNIQNYLELTGQVAGGAKISSNTETSGRFHTDWLNMMYPRLKLARNLLCADGVIFVSIADQELTRLRVVLDDIFGDENFIACIVWQKKQSPQNDATNISDMHDYVVVYARQIKTNKNDETGWQRNMLSRGQAQESRYDNRDNDPRGDWTSSDLTCNKTSEERPNLYYSISNPISGSQIWPSKTRVWAFEKPAMKRLVDELRLWWGRDGSNMPRLKVFRSEVDDGIVPSTWWTRDFAGDNQDARREVRDLFPEADIFSTPKPQQLLARVIEVSTKSSENDLVLDFFAGSGTTGHAVMAQNAADGGNRRYILVQLPEPLDPENKDQKTAANFCDNLGKPRSIAELTKERQRRAGKKVKAENPMFAGDTGFRVFKLDTSNIRTWEPDRANMDKSLEAATIHIKADRTETDILTELLLKLGLDLCVPIQEKTINKVKVQSIGAGVLVVCLAERISRTDAEPLALGIAQWWKELQPAGESTVVFRDSAFEDDIAKSNLAAILVQHGLSNVRSL